MHFMQSEQGPLTYIHVYSYSDLNFKPTQIDYIPTIALKCVLGLRGELVPLEVDIAVCDIWMFYITLPFPYLIISL